MKVIVAGGRNFNDYPLLKQKLDNILDLTNPVTIISGGAYGADEQGENYAAINNLPLEVYKAEWDNMDEPCVIKTRPDGTKYNALAGPNRNRLMASKADALVAFWDQKSRGTKNMIEIARDFSLKIRIIKY